jgi:hypothetical protein
LYVTFIELEFVNEKSIDVTVVILELPFPDKVIKLVVLLKVTETTPLLLHPKSYHKSRPELGFCSVEPSTKEVAVAKGAY